MDTARRMAKIVTVLTAVLAALTGMSATAASAGTPSGSWRQTDYNAALSRANLYEKILTRTTVAKVIHLRSMTAPQPNPNGCSYEGFTAPVLAGGSLYAVAYGHVIKYSPRTGKVVWDSVPDPTFSHNLTTLSVVSGLVIVGQQYCGSVSAPTGVVQSFNAATGALVWSQNNVPYPGRAPVRTMGVSGGYVVVAGSSAEAPNDISVLRLATGALVWYNAAGDCGYGTALVVAQRVISGGCGTPLTARNLATGAVIWSRSGAWRLWRGDTDALTGRHIYATNASGSVVSLNPLTGKTQYSLAGAANVLAVAGARVFAACASSGVCAYSLTSGSRQWDTQSGSATQLASSAGGVLYLDHGLALNTGTGKTMATLWASDSQATGLAVGDGRIAVVSGNGQVLGIYGLPGY
jgi:hypothetical protein